MLKYEKVQFAVVIAAIVAITFGLLVMIANPSLGYRDDSDIDPLAIEVVKQTWSEFTTAQKQARCENAKGHYRKVAKRIVRKYHSNATRKGKVELKAGYVWLLHQC